MNKSLEVNEIDVNKLMPNSWNPNRMSVEMKHKLREYIKREGFVEPIVVRAKGDDSYEILGGYHRWTVASELGYDTVPCVVVDLDDRRAKVLSVNLNELKGQSLPNLLAELIHDLNREISLDDLESQLPYSVDELKDSLELLKIPDGLAEYLDEEISKKEKQRPKILSFVVDDDVKVEKAISVAMARSNEGLTRGKALIDISEHYLSGIERGEL